MIRNYLITAWRSLWRQKSYSFLNIVGLALGIAGTLLIAAYIHVDFTWDRFHEKSDRIYRIVERQDFGKADKTDLTVSMPPLAPQLQLELPEVELAVRVQSAWQGMEVARGEQHLVQQNAKYVDSTFFDLFSFPLAYGDPATALRQRDAILISKTLANQYFGKENPMGETLELHGRREAVVTGILDDFPAGSSISFDILVPFEMAHEDLDIPVDQWGNNTLQTYLLLSPTADVESMPTKITELYHRHGSWEGLEFWIQAMPDWHLHSSEIEFSHAMGQSDISTVRILLTIGLFLLLIAVVNYINLATARSARRAREVGLRKVVGASRGMMMRMFFVESILIATIAALLAGLLVMLLQPSFVQLTGREMQIELPGSLLFWGALASLALIAGLLGGLYPASILSSFQPVATLKGENLGKARGTWFRRGLVIFQFSISIILMVASITMLRQIHYLHSRPLGFEKEGVLVIDRGGQKEYQSTLATLTHELAQVPGVLSVTATSGIPGFIGSQSGAIPEGSENSRMTNYFAVDENLLDTYGMELVEGRFLGVGDSVRVATGDSTTLHPVVINEAMVRKSGWASGTGHTIKMWGLTFQVVGVVKDFHFQSLRQVIEPLVIFKYQPYQTALSIRFKSDNPNALVSQLGNVWTEFFPDASFDPHFLDEVFDRNYRTEQHQFSLLRISTGAAILIACLGLFGLASYAASRRTREIGIRKVLGASVGEIVRLLTREFAWLVIASNLVAWPIAWYLMDRWLDGFAYKVGLAWWIFPLTAIGALLLAIGTTITQAVRAATNNPVRTLRHE